jgi:drug/metabolite transporter (DMT)-like permease
VLAVIGLFLLSVTERFTIGLGDTLVLIGAFFWAGHVVYASWVTKQMSVLRLACLQFATCSILSFAVAFAAEEFIVADIMRAGISILYGGFVSVGIAYTLQLVGQRRTPPAHAAIIMGQEAVFAALGGWLFLSEFLSTRALVGCALMLAGAVLAQLGAYSRRPRRIPAISFRGWPRAG